MSYKSLFARAKRKTGKHIFMIGEHIATKDFTFKPITDILKTRFEGTPVFG